MGYDVRSYVFYGVEIDPEDRFFEYHNGGVTSISTGEFMSGSMIKHHLILVDSLIKLSDDSGPLREAINIFDLEVPGEDKVMLLYDHAEKAGVPTTNAAGWIVGSIGS